jgi:hypothetical protein
MPNFISIIGEWDEFKVTWDNNTCKLVHTNCHSKIYHINIKYHMTPITIFRVIIIMHIEERGLGIS